jgi:alkylation response protein AidB-like acyl-CoA dehydrogenase
MEFKFTDAQLMLQKMVREFAEKEVAPIAEMLDKEHIFPMETFKKMAEIGLTGIGIPVEYEGAGGTDIEKVIIVMEIAKKCAATATVLSVHTSFPQAIIKFGTEEQKKKYLPMMAKGALCGFALTEANAGSDPGSLKTTAVLDEKTGEYIVNGTKIFITGGAQVDALVLIASTDLSKGAKGISAFILEKGTPGFSIGKKEEKMGIHGSETVELIFEDCRIPKENLLGKEGKGFNIALSALDGGRIGIASQALGIAEGAFEETIKYMHERTQFGKALTEFQGLQWYVAEMATKIEAARWLIFYAAYLKSTGGNFGKFAAMAKFNASTVAREVTSLAVQIHGGYGYMRDYPVERMYRDAKITEIYEGTSEIQKIVISRAILG